MPPSFHGFTLAHLTDLHFGFLVSESFIENIVQRTNKLLTDVIVCTGDYVHRRNTTDEIDKVWPILSKLKAKYGVYSVLGNHDHWADTDRSLLCQSISIMVANDGSHCILHSISKVF